MPKFLLTLLLFVGLNSEAAGPRCFDFFSANTVTSARQSSAFYAEAIDQLNAKYDGFLFSEKASSVLQNGSRYRAYRLKKVLKELYAFDQHVNDKAALAENHYALEKLAVKLEKLSFLNDDSVTEKMTLIEKATFRQAQHSLLAGGLAKFLFNGEPTPDPSRMKKIMQPLLSVFKDVYFRWTYAIAYMPKLNGAVIPFDVIEKVVIEGYDANHELLKPYLRTSQGKAAFNVFSSTYNWVLGAPLFLISEILRTRLITMSTCPG